MIGELFYYSLNDECQTYPLENVPIVFVSTRFRSKVQ